jgi:hypothetical protein
MPVESLVSQSLMAPAGYPEPPAGELHHLGHERQRLQAAVLVEGGEDLVDALHLDQLADAEATRLRALGIAGVHLDSPGPPGRKTADASHDGIS